METPESTEPVVEDAPVTEDAPVAETPELETPEVPAGELTPELEPEVDAPADIFTELKTDRATMEAALRMHEAARTEQGVVQLFFEAGRSLGLGVKEIEALFAATQAAEPTEEEDLDRPVTMADIKAMRDAEVQTAAQARQAAATESARTAVADTLTELKVGDDEKAIVLQMGDKYLRRGDTDPVNVAAAVKRGHADYEAAVQKRANDYLKGKVAKAAGVPSAPAGSGAAETPPPAEPKNVTEAIAMARKMIAGG